MKTLYFASANRGKTQEMQRLFTDLADIKDLNDLQIPVTWEETGSTFRENALIKVRALSAIVEGPVFADDSGLCVGALADAPGVYSARWAGIEANDESNNRKLLEQMSHLPDDQRQARFICCLAYRNEKNDEFFFEGEMSGKILRKAKGNKGFGYDPLFVPDGFEKTLAELSIDEKNKISHRFKAVAKFHRFLASLR